MDNTVAPHEARGGEAIGQLTGGCDDVAPGPGGGVSGQPIDDRPPIVSIGRERRE